MLDVAVIGLGNAFEPHAKSLIDLKHRIRVRWAVSPSAARTQAVAEKTGFPVTNDVERAIADPAVQAVIVLTPANVHGALVERCFMAGKHVLVEKPLEASLAAAERMVAAGRAAGKRMGVVLQARFRESSVRLRRALEAGELGRIEAAWMAVPWWRPQSYYDVPGRGTRERDGGGVLLTQAIHTIDLFRSFVGVSEVMAAQVATTRLHRMETEDYAAALLRLGNGAPGTMIATTAAVPGGVEEITIVGSRATARVVGSALKLSFVDGREEVIAGEGGTGGGASIMDFPHDAHRALLADFADAVAEDRDPRVSGEEALESQRLIEAILAKGA
jgi:predicted dehydrogenase